MKNEPAFPQQTDLKLSYTGMTLRDYFAAKALQGIVTRGVVKEVPLELYADNAYKMADAMLKAREQK